MAQELTIIFTDKEYARIEAVKNATGMPWHDLIVESFAKAEDEIMKVPERCSLSTLDEEEQSLREPNTIELEEEHSTSDTQDVGYGTLRSRKPFWKFW